MLPMVLFIAGVLLLLWAGNAMGKRGKLNEWIPIFLIACALLAIGAFLLVKDAREKYGIAETGVSANR